MNNEGRVVWFIRTDMDEDIFLGKPIVGRDVDLTEGRAFTLADLATLKAENRAAGREEMREAAVGLIEPRMDLNDRFRIGMVDAIRAIPNPQADALEAVKAEVRRATLGEAAVKCAKVLSESRNSLFRAAAKVCVLEIRAMKGGK